MALDHGMRSRAFMTIRTGIRPSPRTTIKIHARMAAGKTAGQTTRQAISALTERTKGSTRTRRITEQSHTIFPLRILSLFTLTPLSTNRDRMTLSVLFILVFTRFVHRLGFRGSDGAAGVDGCTHPSGSPVRCNWGHGVSRDRPAINAVGVALTHSLKSASLESREEELRRWAHRTARTTATSRSPAATGVSGWGRNTHRSRGTRVSFQKEQSIMRNYKTRETY